MAFTSVPAGGQAEGFPGTWADNSELQDAVSGFSEETVTEIEFGSGVVKGTGPKGVIVPATGADIVEGIALHSFAHAPGAYGDIGDTGIKPKWGVNVARHGRVRALLDAATVSISPYSDRGSLRWEADGAGKDVLGRWSKTADAHTIDCSKQLVFVGPMLVAPSGQKYAVAEIDFTNKP